MWNGFLVTVLGIQPIVATLVLMTAGRGVAQLITDERIITASSRPYKMIGGGYWLGLPFSIILAGVILLLTALLTRRTALGMLLESVGGNPEASRLAGVPARSITWTVYIVCAVFAGLAGLMITSNATAADPNSTGLFLEIDAILAVVIGGTSLAGGRFSLAGTVIGAFIIQTMTTMILILGIAPGDHARVQGGRRGRRVPDPVARGACRSRCGRSAMRGPAPPTEPAADRADDRRSEPAARRHRARRRRNDVRTGGVMSAVTLATALAAPDPWSRYLPVIGHRRPPARGDRRSAAALRQLRDRPGAGQHPDHQLPPDRARRRHDVRDPHRRHRPVGRRRGRAVGDDRRQADGAGWPAAAAIPVVLLTGSMLGLLVGLMIHYFRIQPFIATLARCSSPAACAS